MEVKGNHPLVEILAKNLFSIETVPPREQRKMVNRAIKAAVAWAKNNKAVEREQAKCICSEKGVPVKCHIHGFTGTLKPPVS